jgi:hypothetical protein
MRLAFTNLAITALLCISTLPGVACETTSSNQTMALVELYTSEGCSSCPPADHWFSGFSKTSNGKAIALAFHVDYWDYLGWRDRFDSPRYSQRQHDLVAASGGSAVYTPQLMIDGADHGSWGNSDIAAQIAAINRRPPGAQLTLRLDASGDKRWNAKLTGLIQRPTNKEQIWLAVYENGLSSDVRAGENRGAELNHDRVVRGWYGPFKAGSDGRINLQQDIEIVAPLNPGQAGLVAFVQDLSFQRVLQAVVLPFCLHS